MTVSLVGTWFVVRKMSQDVISMEKSNKLLLAANLLDFQLGDRDYEQILVENGAENASKEEKIALLNNELFGFGEVVTRLYPDIGIGYYSLDLDAILTYAPSKEYKDTIGKPIGKDHPGRVVMQDNKAMVRTGSMVRGNILNAMHPIERSGRVIGYAWANELTTSIETVYKQTSNSILIATIVIYAFSIGMIVVFSKQSMKDIYNIIKGVRVLRSDLSYKIPKASGDLGEVVESINSMAADIKNAAEEHKALILAEASNLAQRDFLARMSHEIRTPMNGVLGMTKLAQSAKTDSQRLEYLGKIHASASLLLGIINDILDISKIEAQKMKLEEQPFRLSDVIDNIRDLMAPRVNEKNLKFIITVAESVPKVMIGDSLRISQVLFNIVGNAVKFTLEGTVSLLISAEEISNNKLRLNFRVCDTGIGMDDKQQDMFKAFIQADSSTARKFGGSGLGLSISKALIELMGGKISVTSRIGEGSEFEFYLFTTNHEGDVRKGSEDTFTAISDQKYDNFSLLVVEDNEINREIAKAIFENMGFEIDFANDGKEGVDAFSAKNYDLIFMDIRMPVMDGLEASREIRKIEQERAQAGGTSSHVPIIAMTANVMQSDKDDTHDAGMDGHVSKPIDIDEIHSILYSTLKKSPVSD